MTSDENYLSTEKAEAVMKYTSKNPLKLLVIMPKGKTTLEDYLKLFDVAEYNSLLNSMNIKNNVKAELPQFSVDSGSEAKPLSGILSTCGFSTLFSKDAKFKTMNIANKLKLDEMYELEPSVTISSNGILNGASEKTADISALKSGGGDTKLNSNKTLRFDKPFIFMLVDNESNIPVYAGVYQK
jgi:serpin B